MTSLVEQQEIIQKFKDIDASIRDDVTWNADNLLNKLTTIDNYLKQRVGTQARYTGLAKEKIRDIKSEFTRLKTQFKDLNKRMKGFQKTIAENENEKVRLNELVRKLQEEAEAADEEINNDPFKIMIETIFQTFYLSILIVLREKSKLSDKLLMGEVEYCTIAFASLLVL